MRPTKYQVATARQHRDGTWHRPGFHLLYCHQCGEMFASTRADALTCSNACRQRAYRLRNALRS